MNSNTTNLTSAEIESQLKYYTGTTRYYRFSSFHPYTFLTDGALEAQKLLECNWLFLHIASRQEHYKIKNCPYLQQIQFWTFTVNHETSDNLLICERDTNDIAYKISFDYTDFKLAKFHIYVQPTEIGNTACEIIHLPSEY